MCPCSCKLCAAQALEALLFAWLGRRPASLRQPNGCNMLKSGGIVPSHWGGRLPLDLKGSLSSLNPGAHKLLEFRQPVQLKSFWRSRSSGARELLELRELKELGELDSS